MLNIVIQSL